MQFIVITTLALAASLACASAQAATRYTLELLGDPPGGFTSSQGMAINASGLVAGQSAATGGFYATQWAAPGRQPASLGTLPGGTSSMVYGINDLGTTVGTSDSAHGGRGFYRLADGTMFELADLPGGNNYSGALAVNNAGITVGYSYSTLSGNNPVATVWGLGTPALELGDLPGGFYQSSANAINNSGVVAGYGRTATGRRAFVWTPGSGMVELPHQGRGEWDEAFGINDAGVIVGSSQWVGTSDVASHATLWRDGQLIDLESGRVGSQAYDINNLGLVVGIYNDRATLWTEGQPRVYLANQVDNLPFGMLLSSARSINDAGQITGWATTSAGVRVGYLLNPAAAVPEPAAWAQMLAGLCLTASLLRRRQP